MNVSYFLKSAAKYFTPFKCPSCGNKELNKVVDKKFIVTRLVECQHCNLLFRHPTDDITFNQSFYQDEYKQEDGITTTVSKEVDDVLKSVDIAIGRTAERLLKIMDSIYGVEKRSKKVLDYGCSWGYQSHQIQQAGIDVQGFEISRPRASYGIEKLGIDIKTNESQLRDQNDIFYSSHVLEHVPAVKYSIELGTKLLRENGLLILITPNGSGEFKSMYPENFKKGWGLVHPNYLNANFYKNQFKNVPYYIGTSGDLEQFNYSAIFDWYKNKIQIVDNLKGGELLVIAHANNQL